MLNRDLLFIHVSLGRRSLEVPGKIPIFTIQQAHKLDALQNFDDEFDLGLSDLIIFT
jgi:hypothetical protein